MIDAKKNAIECARRAEECLKRGFVDEAIMYAGTSDTWLMVNAGERSRKAYEEQCVKNAR